MQDFEPITLRRDCQAIQIPSGIKVTLPAGSEVRITQSLGGTYTVSTDQGYLARVDSRDADALGKAPPREPGSVDPASPPPGKLDKEGVERSVWAQLRTVYDPEIPVNIVDLGLVYLCRVLPHPEGGYAVEVTMTLTAPGCGMGDVLRADAQSKIESLPSVARTEVKLVVEPPWHPSLMTEAARLELGMM
jgi:probable FeS assembly SUF system protein SufT